MTTVVLTPVCDLTDEQLLVKYQALLDEGILSGRQTVRLWAIGEELERRGYVAVNDRADWQKEGARK